MQYDRWFAAVLTMRAGPAAAGARSQGFRPLVIGLHWPSLPWGDESLPPAGGGVLSGDSSIDGSPTAYAFRIADTPPARQALATILAAAAKAQETTLTPDLLAAYHVLFARIRPEHGRRGRRAGE